jgi:hypothetical protein
VGVASFVGELRHQRWRFMPQLALGAMLAALVIIYWP